MSGFDSETSGKKLNESRTSGLEKLIFDQGHKGREALLILTWAVKALVVLGVDGRTIVLKGWSLLPNALRPFSDLLCSPEFRYYLEVNMPIKFCSEAYFSGLR